ncbi:MAG: MerR family transcriptional regulator [Myxococcota bacterium]
MANEAEAFELTYPLGAASRLTGLSPELLRAWERRHGVVEPLRTPGGTRRYTAEQLERLRRLKAAVDAGHRISQVASLSDDDLARLVHSEPPPSGGIPTRLWTALEALDGHETQRLLTRQFTALGPVAFARDFAYPFIREVGERWASGRLDIAAEHLATVALRALLGSALVPSRASLDGPRVVLATPSGERHELGLQMAALAIMGAGANPVYLGAEVPIETLLSAAEQADADAVALSIVNLPAAEAQRAVAALRAGLPQTVRLWLGGSGAAALERVDGVEHLDDLAALEERVARLGFERRGTNR